MAAAATVAMTIRRAARQLILTTTSTLYSTRMTRVLSANDPAPIAESGHEFDVVRTSTRSSNGFFCLIHCTCPSRQLIRSETPSLFLLYTLPENAACNATKSPEQEWVKLYPVAPTTWVRSTMASPSRLTCIANKLCHLGILGFVAQHSLFELRAAAIEDECCADDTDSARHET